MDTTYTKVEPAPIGPLRDLSAKAMKARGEKPEDYFWPFNGLRPDGERFSMDPAEFVAWASALHPEYIDAETGAPLLYDFVFTQTDEELMGVDGLAGTVMVTILPSLDGLVSYTHAAWDASNRYPANPKVAARFIALAELFAAERM